MANICASATLWPTIQLQVRSTVRELIREHASPKIGPPENTGSRLGFEHIALLWSDFLQAHPAMDVSYEEYRAEVNYMLGHSYWLVIRRNR